MEERLWIWLVAQDLLDKSVVCQVSAFGFVAITLEALVIEAGNQYSSSVYGICSFVALYQG
jgi:hypothetical protein